MPRAPRRRRLAVPHPVRALAESMERRTLLTAATADVPIHLTSPAVVGPAPVYQGAAPAVAAPALDGPLATLSVPSLSSLPSATAKLYLDFDGDPASNWDGTSVPAIPAYDIDGNAASFTPNELVYINEIWARVAEKYSPFNIDVTTVRPSDFNNRHAIHIVIGGDGAWYGSAGGVAPLGAFSNASDNVAYVFPGQLANGTPKFVAEAAAHEAGHTFGLEHQSEYSGTTLTQQYSDNDPATTGDTFSAQPTAPTMGYSYDATRGLWWKGKNAVSSTTIQDDMAVIAGGTNGFGYRADDHGSTLAAADAMAASGSTVTASGVIGTTADVDYLSFQSQAGSVSFTLSVATTGATLNAAIELRSASDTLLASRDTGTLGETLTFTIPSTGTYYLVVKSHGSYGDVGQYTVTGTVNAVPLTPAPNGPYAVTEGGTVQLSAAGSLGQISKYEWDLDYDGVTFTADKTGAAPTVAAAAFDGPAVRTVALRVTDSANNTAIATTTLTVTNANPTATFASSGPVTEGSTTATVSFTNPTDPSTVDKAAGLLYSFDFDNDGAWDVTDSPSPTATIPAALVADGPATFTVRGRIADKDGGSNTYTTTVTVTNRLPTATLTPADASIPQGGSTTVSFTSPADAATDAVAGFTYSFDLNNDGTFDVTNSPTATANVSAATLGDTPGPHTVRARIKDKDGGFTDYTTTVTVTNVAPTAAASALAGVEGSDIVVTVTNPFDPSAADTAAGFKYSFDFGADGTFDVVDSASNTRTYPTTDQGTYFIIARIKDRNGGYTDYFLSPNLANVSPVAFLAPGGSVAEGSAGTVSFGPVTDPGSADVAAGFKYSFDFDDDGTFEVVDSASPTATVPASFLADGPFVRTVRGRVTDKDGDYNDDLTTITVTNVAPTLVTPASANGHVVLGTGYSLSLASQDPGQDTISSWTVDWGDGRTSHATTPAAVLNHDYDAKGNYAVVITAADEDGSAYTLDRTVDVTSDPPTVAAASTGAVSQDAATIQFTVTYTDDLGIRTTSLDDADVSVTGPHGPAQSVHLLSAVPTDDGLGVVATYEAAGPAGEWGWQDDGTYTVAVNPHEVIDQQGDSLDAGPVTTFSVDLDAPTAPDLVATYASPVKLQPSGGKNAAAVKVYNRGTRNLPTSNVTTSLYLSADPFWDESDTLLASSTQKLSLVINASKTFTFSFATPPVATTGTYYVLARVDSHSAVSERDERNNATPSNKVALAARNPDLAASLAGKPKRSYKPGQSLPLSLKLRNVGLATAAGPVGVRFVLSADSVLDDSDLTLLTKSLRTNLKSKASAAFNFSAKIPPTAAGHTWHLLAVLTTPIAGDANAANNAAASAAFSVTPITRSATARHRAGKLR